MVPDDKPPASVQQTAIGDGIIQIVGDDNTVNQTITQKILSIFRSNAETMEHRNRRIMLGHIEKFWVKGILENSLHGAALLELGMKEDPDALSFPWAIKREASNEIVPAGTSMLTIFQTIGMGRSLLILGAPGAGKTTMLLELARQLIECANQDFTEPVPVVFNLSSWTENKTLAEWLATELNAIYYVPKSVAESWVKENKLLLLLDGLDEVGKESRGKCVDAINLFRKENGLTSIVVCSRINDYAELKPRLSFEGAIEIQPLTSDQVDEYFRHFGEQLAGIAQVLKKDLVLSEIAETPLFLSIMTIAYRDTKSADILTSGDLGIERKKLFDTYIERMLERLERSKTKIFNKNDVLRWLSWLANKMIEQKSVPYLIEDIQIDWLTQKKQLNFKLMRALSVGLLVGLSCIWLYRLAIDPFMDFANAIVLIAILGLTIVFFTMAFRPSTITLATDPVRWDTTQAWAGMTNALGVGLISTITLAVCNILLNVLTFGQAGFGIVAAIIGGLLGWPIVTLFGLMFGLSAKPQSETAYPGHGLWLTIRNGLVLGFLFGLSSWWYAGLIAWIIDGPAGLISAAFGALIFMIILCFLLGGFSVMQHYMLRYVIGTSKLLPFRLVRFLDYCTELLFLRRVGGGYIFIHRLLMEHFAAMYSDTEK